MRLWLVAVAVAAAKCWFTLIQLIVSRLSLDLLLTRLKTTQTILYRNETI